MERFAAELGEDKYSPEPGMDAVADRNIDEAEFTSNGNSWLAAFLGQRI